MKQNLFVYGSLKRGFHNHSVLTNEAEPTPATLEGAKMYSLGPYPAIVLSGDREETVSGEMYSVTKEAVARIDAFEGHPTYYCRKSVVVKDGDGAAHDAWVYEYARRPKELSEEQRVLDGNWTVERSY